MKKIFLMIITILLITPVVCKAGIDYDIRNYYINANILENGDLDVTELIVLDGEFNGYIREVVYENRKLGNTGYESNLIYNAKDIEILDISAKKVHDVSFDTLNDSNFLELEEGRAGNGGFLNRDIGNGYSYKMYFRGNDEKIAFKIHYKIIDALVLHKDVAELYWTFIGSDFTDILRDVQIKVNLPKKDDSNLFRVWAHGDMTGLINMYDNSYALASINKLDKENPVDVRLTFSPSLLDSKLVNKKTNEEALNGIIEIEEKRANDQNIKRQKAKHLFYGFLITSIIYFIILIIMWIYIYFKYDKEYKSTFTNPYNREFIDEYNVEVVDYLMNKNITPNAMSASIMNLAYKKVISVNEIPTDKKKKDYEFTLVNEENCNETEKYLINFLFNKVGKENKFTTKDLKHYAESTKTCEAFSNSYRAWRNKVISDAKKENFFESTATSKTIGIIFFIISIVMVVMVFNLNIIIIMPYINVFLSLIFLIYTEAFFRRTKRGNEHYTKWKAFKKFLNDFSNFEIKELPEIALWERYMVYATVFGLAEKVSKCMNVRIKELEASGIYPSYTPTFSDYYWYTSINNSITNSISSNSSAITALHAGSSSSSGSGFGGGFSSGGGFGGGGGGGHGF